MGLVIWGLSGDLSNLPVSVPIPCPLSDTFLILVCRILSAMPLTGFYLFQPPPALHNVQSFNELLSAKCWPCILSAGLSPEGSYAEGLVPSAAMYRDGSFKKQTGHEGLDLTDRLIYDLMGCS